MNAAETLLIARFVKGACPAQKFDEYTPDVWTQLLEDINYDDALAAVKLLGRRLAFIGPPDIRGEVRRIRNERLREQPLEPEFDGGDVGAYLEAVKQHRRAIGDGQRIEPVAINPAGRERVIECMKEVLAKLPSIPKADYGEKRARFNADGSPASVSGLLKKAHRSGASLAGTVSALSPLTGSAYYEPEVGDV